MARGPQAETGGTEQPQGPSHSLLSGRATYTVHTPQDAFTGSVRPKPKQSDTQDTVQRVS